jgi:hypothetical protein
MQSLSINYWAFNGRVHATIGLAVMPNNDTTKMTERVVIGERWLQQAAKHYRKLRIYMAYVASPSGSVSMQSATASRIRSNLPAGGRGRSQDLDGGGGGAI